MLEWGEGKYLSWGRGRRFVHAVIPHNPARMLLIVRRPYAHLEDRLRRAFEGRDDVEVIADQRRGERRMSDRGAPVERRRAERRTSKEEILEVVIHGDPLTMFR